MVEPLSRLKGDVDRDTYMEGRLEKKLVVPDAGLAICGVAKPAVTGLVF